MGIVVGDMAETANEHDSDAGLSSEYPWNVRILVGGVTFEGPGMETEREAQGIKNIVEKTEGVENVEVFRQ